MTGYLALSLLTLGLESCISLYTGRFTVIDTGGALAGIGQEQPRVRKEIVDGKPGHHYKVWKKGDAYIVQVPVAYVPAYYPILLHATGRNHQRNTLSRIRLDYTDAEIMSFPIEHCFVTLDETQYKVLCRVSKSDCFLPPPSALEGVPLHPKADLKGAELIVAASSNEFHHIGLPHLWKLDIETLPPRRTWYNRCLQPLSWMAEVVDVPLTIVATPIGWVVDAIYEPLHN